MSVSAVPQNRLLASLPSTVLERLSHKLEPIQLKLGDRLYDPGNKFTHVYFVESGIVAILVIADDDSALQCCMDGNEGMVGVPAFLGIDVAENRAVVQASGSALRMKIADLREECALQTELHKAMQGFTYSTIANIATGSACNRFHTSEARMARWLMMTQDRLRSSKFRITQEFLAYMLGLRREAINKIARHFQRAELIDYRRGNFSIIDRKGLERVVCSCYQGVG